MRVLQWIFCAESVTLLDCVLLQFYFTLNTIAMLLCFFSSLPILVVYSVVQAADIIKVIVGYVLIRKGKWISNIVEKM